MKRNKAEDTGLSPRQMRYISALLTGKTKAQAAHEAGVTDRCARSWHNQPRFQQALQSALDGALRDVLTDFASLLPDVVHAFADGLRSGTPQQRASVAEKVVTTLLRLRVDVDFASRVERLENMMGVYDAQFKTETEDAGESTR
ncbi:hypothetical protein HRbin16_03060 [bacterium HR16]|nr:hypothetical protein HRbin16_03060 [bacterium HR16]